MAQVQEREHVGSRNDRRRATPLGWVPWVALLLLLGLMGLAWLLIANVTDENDRAGVDASLDDEVAAGAPTADTGGVDCPSATDAGARLFDGIDGIVGCRVDAEVVVGDVADDDTFTVEDGGAAVLVIDESGGTVLEPDQRIRLIGTVRTQDGTTVVVASSTTPA